MNVKRLLIFMVIGVSLLPLVPQLSAAQSEETHTHEAGEISPEVSQLISDVRQETAPFRDFSSIEDAGYGKFLDCFVNNEVGAMGQHFVNGELVGDDVVNPMKPEALVYQPTADGDMILVAFEYLVFADKWDPNNEGREAPVLFNQQFHLKTTIPDTPPVWTLHLWLWTANPDGTFADFNPTVFCPADYTLTDMTPQ